MSPGQDGGRRGLLSYREREDRGYWRQANLCALRWWLLSVPLKCYFAVLFSFDSSSACWSWKGEGRLFEKLALQTQEADQGGRAKGVGGSIRQGYCWQIWSGVSPWMSPGAEAAAAAPQRVWTRVSGCSKEGRVWPTHSSPGPTTILHWELNSLRVGFWVAWVGGPHAVLFSFKFLSALLYYFCLPTSVFFLVVSCSLTLLSACKSVSALHPGLCQHRDLSVTSLK